MRRTQQDGVDDHEESGLSARPGDMRGVSPYLEPERGHRR